MIVFLCFVYVLACDCFCSLLLVCLLAYICFICLWLLLCFALLAGLVACLLAGLLHKYIGCLFDCVFVYFLLF